MNKLNATIIAVFMLMAGLFATSCASFSTETKEFSAVVTELAATQAVFNNIILGWHSDILESYKLQKQLEAQAQHEAATGELLPLDAFTVALQMTNPKYDASDPTLHPEYIYKDIDEIVNNIKDVMKMNMEIAESLDILDESIQADRGLDPLFEEVKKILADEQVMALVKLYAEELRKKP